VASFDVNLDLIKRSGFKVESCNEYCTLLSVIVINTRFGDSSLINRRALQIFRSWF
jgi:hypothetical protein